MKPIDDAMIIAALIRRYQDKRGCAATWLQLLTGQDSDDCVKALADAEDRGLIRYEVCDASYSSRTPEAKPEDGWKMPVANLFARLDKAEDRIQNLERSVYGHQDIADTIHDEEGEQDG